MLKLETKYFKVELDNGYFLSFVDTVTGKNHLPSSEKAPIMKIRVVSGPFIPSSEKKTCSPSGMAWKKNGDIVLLELEYAELGGVKAEISVQVKPAYLVFELKSINPYIENLDIISWGPYPTDIKAIKSKDPNGLVLVKNIGETVGVVHDGSYAIGIQSLNVNTDAGSVDGPAVFNAPNEKFWMAISDQLLFSEMHPSYYDYPGFGLSGAACPRQFGSSLQLDCWDYTKNRIFDNFEVPAIENGSVIGSKIALYGCPVKEILDTIGEIEIAEGLPHPVIDGKWIKTNYAHLTDSYFILPFNESNIDGCIKTAKKAGIKYFYHGGMFSNSAHMILNSDLFPNGWDGFKSCAEKAGRDGIGIGFHIMSNWVDLKDSYVTPVPDERLAKIYDSKLSENIDSSTTEITVDYREFAGFTTQVHAGIEGWTPPVQAAMIGKELVKCSNYSVSDKDKFVKMSGCERGAFGTKASPHKKGDSVSKLNGYDEFNFLGNMELSNEIAERVADFCNYTGARQLSFDGLEGVSMATGISYSVISFIKSWYDKLKPELKGIMNDASGTGHYYWHIYPRMNWGEPWWEKFRTSQCHYRIKNQQYFARNLMPGMFGWFLIKDGVTNDDIEWMLARCAGYDAGFALVINNDLDDSFAELIKQWEKARKSGAFPEELKPDLQNITKDFHLETVSGTEWDLFPVMYEVPAKTVNGFYQYPSGKRTTGKPIRIKSKIL